MASLDCARIRSDFPELSSGLVYLDNAASTLKPRQVVESMTEFLARRYANVHRGLYRLSAEATRLYEEAREVVARFIGARPDEVVFVRNTTEALNMVAWALALNRVVVEGDEIIVTEAEHNSNLLPWLTLARLTRASLRVIQAGPDGVPRWDRLLEAITRRTRVVAVSMVSNVTGARAPVEEIAREARANDALLVVDGAQGVPHVKVDVDSLGADFLAFSGHKMLGPTGIGVLWGRRGILEELDPPAPGGGTVADVSLTQAGVQVVWEDPPQKFEAGTPPIAEAIGLRAAVDYLDALGMERVEDHSRRMAKLIVELLEDAGATIVGPREGRIGIVAFNIPGMRPDEAALRLGARGVAVRAGMHCAFLLHKRLGLQGSVRASVYIYNCEDDAEKLAEEVRKLAGGQPLA